MKKILLVGGTGFIGSHLAEAIEAEATFGVATLSRRPRQKETPVLDFVGDIAGASFPAWAIKEFNPDFVYYLATDFQVNSAEKYRQACELCEKGIRNLTATLKTGTKLIHVGSSAQYGRVKIEDQPVSEDQLENPINYYGKLKVFEAQLIEHLSEQNAVIPIFTKIFNLLGPGEPERMIGGSIAAQLRSENVIRVGNLFPKRDFLDVRDASQALLLIGDKGIGNESYNICSGRSTSIQELLNLILETSRSFAKIKRSPSRVNPNDISELIGDNQKLLGLGWKQQYSLQDSVKALLEI